MKLKKITIILSLGVVVGFLFGFATSLYYTILNKYIQYKTYRLIVLTFQKSLNGSILFMVCALLSFYILSKRSKAVQFRIKIFVILALLLFIDRLLRTFARSTLCLAIENSLSKLGSLLAGKISLNYFVNLLEEYIRHFIILAGGIGVIITLLIRQSIFKITKTKYIKITAWVLVASLLILNLCIVIDGKINTSNKPNVILIVADALRPDHLGCYGYTKNTSPNIDRLANESTLFKTTVTVFPSTTPSAVSMLTGLYPHTHGTRSLYATKDRYALLKNLTLAEILKNEKYITAAFICQFLLHKKSGLQQGFLTYINCGDDKLSEKAISRLKNYGNGKRNRPFFLLLWYRSPHWPYRPPKEDLELFSNDKNIDLEELFKRDAKNEHSGKFYNQKEVEFLIGAYDDEIHYVDKQIGAVIDYLKESGLYRNSIIVLTADHGESLGEHDYYFGHGRYYYDQSALVPLLIKRPNQDTKEVVDYQVRNIDIFPTVLGALNINYTCEGKNLFPSDKKQKEELKSLLAFGENDYPSLPSDRRRYIEGIAGKWRIARSNRWKLIFIPHPEKNIYELYDIKNDPKETNNLIDNPEYQNEVEYLKEKLFDWIKPQDLEDKEAIPIEQMDESTKERLRSLGYL